MRSAVMAAICAAPNRLNPMGDLCGNLWGAAMLWWLEMGLAPGFAQRGAEGATAGCCTAGASGRAQERRRERTQERPVHKKGKMGRLYFRFSQAAPALDLRQGC